MNIHKIKENIVESFYYTLIGDEDFLDEYGNPAKKSLDNSVCAKAVKNKPPKAFQSNTLNNSAGFSYYIKASPNRVLHNPVSLYSTNSSKPSFIDSVCKKDKAFIEVNKAIFDKYLTFLKTKNIQWLTEAQREIK
jgi:hypothetical protein